MSATRVPVTTAVVVSCILLAGCTSNPSTTEHSRAEQGQTQAPTATSAPERTEKRPEQPADYSPEEFVQRCIDRADNVLQFWDEGVSSYFGGGLHIRARDVVVYVGSEAGLDGYFAEFPNQSVPGENFYCWTAPAGPYSTGIYPNHSQDIWLRIRGPVFYEVDVNLEGDAFYRVSQDPVWYEKTG